jgi:hypothetical protein
MGDAGWTIGVQYITSMGNMIYGFSHTEGRLWSFDTSLHVSRSYTNTYPLITGI